MTTNKTNSVPTTDEPIAYVHPISAQDSASLLIGNRDPYTELDLEKVFNACPGDLFVIHFNNEVFNKVEYSELTNKDEFVYLGDCTFNSISGQTGSCVVIAALEMIFKDHAGWWLRFRGIPLDFSIVSYGNFIFRFNKDAEDKLVHLYEFSDKIRQSDIQDHIPNDTYIYVRHHR